MDKRQELLNRLKAIKETEKKQQEELNNLSKLFDQQKEALQK